MSKLLENKLAFVTGGSKGIGAAIVKKLSDEGAKVHFTYSSSEEAAKAVASENQAVMYHLDASKPEAMADFVNKFVAEQGIPDVIVNNAGIAVFGMVGEYQFADLVKQFNINVFSTVELTNAFVPYLKAGARIITITSSLGERAAAASMGMYNATKFALNGFVRSWAKDLGAKNILVNAVLPGPIDTDANPDSPNNPGRDFMIQGSALQRFGRSEEVAEVVAFLAGSGSSNITGATFNVDGGWNA